MQIASSARWTGRLCASASLYTATDWMPSSRQARMMRTAISPRFAMTTFSIGVTVGTPGRARNDCRPDRRHARRGSRTDRPGARRPRRLRAAPPRTRVDVIDLEAEMRLGRGLRAAVMKRDDAAVGGELGPRWRL